MTPAQDEMLVDLAFALDSNAGEQARVSAAAALRIYVNTLLAAERAAVVEECAKVCALLFEASRALHREQMETISDFTHGYRAGISTAEAAIRKLGEKRE